MKKIGGYIMLLLVLANLFAPLSVTTDNTNSKIIQTNKAEADSAWDCTPVEVYCGRVQSVKLDSHNTQNIGPTTTALFGYKLDISKVALRKSSNIKQAIVIRIKKPDGKYIVWTNLNGGLTPTESTGYRTIQRDGTLRDGEETKVYDGTLGVNLTPSTAYTIDFTSEEVSNSRWDELKVKTSDDIIFNGDIVALRTDASTARVITSGTTFSTPELGSTGDTTNVATGGNENRGDTAKPADSIMPGCAIMPNYLGGGNGTFMGCLVQGFYYIVFVPTSFLFAMGGKFFDFAFKYSIQDSSYRTGFVVEGWKIVRDLCNIFFIFVILTAAIKMILNIGHGAKDAIINVIIIGLLINFSLFATQIIIDSSNILARLFYNSNAITVAVTGGKNATRAGVMLNNTSSDTLNPISNTTDEISLSAALVDKVDPQAIILNAKNINITSKEEANNLTGVGSTSSNDGIGVGAFFLVTLLSTVVNLLGFFVFLSIALIFIGRVVGLWFAMVFVPLAFFSYTMPGMLDDMEMFGWKKWWPETLKLAFTAPIFMFFMYLIILFLSKGFMDLFKADAHDAEFVLQTIIPFAVIMTLMWKAKSIATTMAGSTAGMVAKGVAAAGGTALALTGAGIAVGGRSLGRLSARAANGETATQRYEAGKTTTNKFQRFADDVGSGIGLGKIGSAVSLGKMGSKIGLGKVYGNTMDIKSKKIDSGLGGMLNKAQHKVLHSDHAKSEMDGLMKDAHLEGLDPKNMTGEQAAEVKKKFDEKKKAAIVTEVKEGKVKDSAGNNVKSENDYSIAKRKEIEDKIREDAEIAYRSKNNLVAGPVTRAQQDAIDKESDKAVKNAKSDTNDRVQQGYRKEVLEAAVKVELEKKFDTLKKDAKEKVSTSNRLISQANTGSWNPGNISAMTALKNDAISSKMLFGISSAIALGMRGGLKSVVGVNPGVASKDFATDIKNAFSEALKSANFKVDIKAPAAHGGGGHDDHGHGGGGGHH